MARERELNERFKKRKEAQAPRTEAEKQAAAKKEYDELLNARSGGRYVPPARLRELQSQITDKSSKEYQRMAWEALKKSINGLVNKVNTSNIKHIVPELFSENLVRGKGLFARSVMRAAAASTPFIPIYACMVAIVNTKLPQVGELLLHRLISQFKKAFKRNDKAVCLSSSAFIAHLSNFSVVSELLPAQCFFLLLNKPTDDSVEIAVGLMKEVGAHLEETNKAIATAVYDQFRNLLHEADLDKRQQYSIEVLFQIRKDQYKDNPAVPEALDILPEEDLIEHRVGLDDSLNTQDTANIFKYDAEYDANEQAYAKLRSQILGEAEDSDAEEGYGTDDSEESEEGIKEREMEIKDQTNQDLVNLRRTIYLTIMSSSTFEEATHKLMKIKLPAEKESELVSMLVEVCCQEKTYSKLYDQPHCFPHGQALIINSHGLIGERLAKLNRLWMDLFEKAFIENYETIHRRETSQLRNNAKFWGHMLSSDAISWQVFSVIALNEDDTTSSSRIFIKILIQDIVEALGMSEVQRRFKDEILKPNFVGLFPVDNPRNTRFSINYFTSIGMGALTEEMREHLKAAPKLVPLPAKQTVDSDTDSVSSYSSYSSYSSSSRSYSRSRSPSRARGRDRSQTPVGRKYARSTSRSRSPPNRSYRDKGYRRSWTRSLTPPRRREHGESGRLPTRHRRSSSHTSRSPSVSNRRRRRSVSSSFSSRSPPRRGHTRRRSRSYSSRSRTPPRRSDRSRRE